MEGRTTFTNDELEANNLAFNDLVELIRSGDAILMAGAGSSGALFPAWTAFMSQLQSLAIEIDPDFAADKNSPLEFADAVKVCLGDDRYYSIIYDTFKPGDPTHLPFHENLCRLPFKAITTTNGFVA